MHQTFYLEGISIVRFIVNKNTYQKVTYAGDLDGVLEGCIAMGLGYVYRLHRFEKISNFSPIRHN